jgi:D-aminopeptidase
LGASKCSVVVTLRKKYRTNIIVASSCIAQDQLTNGQCLFSNCTRGSIIVTIGTNPPLLPHQLDRLARRATLGIGRGGTPGGNSSGHIFLAFSTVIERPLLQLSESCFSRECLNYGMLDAVYLATVEATEEAVLSALVAAEDMTTLGPAKKICRALDHNRLVEIMQRYGRA